MVHLADALEVCLYSGQKTVSPAAPGVQDTHPEAEKKYW